MLYSDPEHCLAVAGRTVISFSLQPPNARYLQAWAAAMDRLAQQSSEPISALTVIDSRARVPDDAAKAEIRNNVLRHQKQICAFAYVIEGQGFAAAAMRSAISFISLLARYPFPQKAFPNIAAGTAWMIQQTPAETSRATSAAEIISVLEAMRQQLTQVAETG
jgi:phytoene/squalene synthetase